MIAMSMSREQDCWLTPRAADLGYVPRYFELFLASGFFRFDGESTLPPQAANASRWAFENYPNSII